MGHLSCDGGKKRCIITIRLGIQKRSTKQEGFTMGAIERRGYVFEPEYSVINQAGAIHVYQKGDFIEEIKFSFEGQGPDFDQIEKLIDEYCDEHGL
jgi:hypothetical protein